MKRKVAIYARVSTEHEAQLSALENQVQYYDEILKKHPEWQLVERYIDEGITGTSIKKRKNFMRMLEDAEQKKFDLIVTREVSRFARNTVDTLQKTRELKKIGVEVYFTEDNIWTFNDEDGELKLTIMATLAQNESKKISQRVKAGQMISFKNGVIYGTGNILGYDKVGKDFIINEEQAELVRFIFYEYLSGKGTPTIAKELENADAVTSTGLTRWTASYITRVLRNPFYCGTIVYRKSYIPDYLEQKPKRNRGEVEQVTVEGKHTPIISKEDFNKVQELLSNHSIHTGINRKQTIGVPRNIWSRKLICECGSNYNRKTYHKNKHNTTYCYTCYKKKLKKCNCKDLQEWKLEYMGEWIFRNLTQNSENRLQLTRVLLDKVKIDPHEEITIKKKIKKLRESITIIDSKLDRLLHMYLDKLINNSTYQNHQDKLYKKMEKYQLEVIELENALYFIDPPEVKKEKARKSIQRLLDINYSGLNEELIEEFVEKIIVHKDYFEWKLNFTDETFKIKLVGKREKDCLIEEYIDNEE